MHCRGLRHEYRGWDPNEGYSVVCIMRIVRDTTKANGMVITWMHGHWKMCVGPAHHSQIMAPATEATITDIWTMVPGLTTTWIISTARWRSLLRCACRSGC